MSTMNNHDTLMNKAFLLALSRMGITSPNPPVGALVVKDGIIVSEGGTQACGGDHAEVCALGRAGESARGGDMYVSLEPCCHHGKTPPCTDAIIRAGIKRVFLPINDPNPKVSGQGIETLRAAGIDVTILSQHQSHARQILNPFFTRIEKHRPYVLYKTAHTADGFMATMSGDSKWISSSASRYAMHRLRAMTDVVIVGKGTFAADNPSLTCRLREFSENTVKDFDAQNPAFNGNDNIVIKYLLSNEYNHIPRDPLRILVGLPDQATIDMNIFTDNNLMVFEKESSIAKRKGNLVSILQKRNLLVAVPDDADNIECVMKMLYEKGILYVLLEGGPTLASSFFTHGYIDEYLAIVAPKVLGGGKMIFSGEGSEFMKDSIPLHDITTGMIGTDLIYHGYF